MRMVIQNKMVIENIGGVFYINKKRIGRDMLTHAEFEFMNNFFKAIKDEPNN